MTIGWGEHGSPRSPPGLSHIEFVLLFLSWPATAGHPVLAAPLLQKMLDLQLRKWSNTTWMARKSRTMTTLGEAHMRSPRLPRFACPHALEAFHAAARSSHRIPRTKPAC
jgi:hypothetical protein